MARALSLVLAALSVAVAPAAGAECVFDQDNEITNPFEPGCGDVVLTYTANDNAGNNIALGFPPPVPVASLTPVDGFRDYASLFAQHQSLLTIHDEVTGEPVGETVAGREIWAYVIGDDDAVTSEGFAEAAVLVNGGIHAREWQTTEAVTGLFEALVAMKSDTALGQYLVDNLNTVLLPVNNVDGFLQTQQFPLTVTADREQPREGRMRRKNLRDPASQAAIDAGIVTVADNFWGVDLNRNSMQGFGQFDASSTRTTSLVYRGETPDSEPELLALRNAAVLGPENRLRLYIDTHSFGQVYFAPTSGHARRDAITRALALRMTAASARTYAFEPDPPGSTGIGTTADHFAFTWLVPAWTMELEPRNGGQDYGGLAAHGHSGFILPDSEVARMREDVTRQYLLGFYRQSGPPAAVAAQVRDVETDAIVYDASWQRDGATTRALTVSINDALIPGRDYRLWVAFNKPMRVRDADDAVIPYPGQGPGAAVGTVTLEIPSLSGRDIALGDDSSWLAVPGGAPDGYWRYRDDAFAVTFTLPADIAVAAATAAVLSLSVRDLSEMALDADPGTAVDWEDGSWVRYEDADGEAGDVGGASCAFRPFIAMQANATPPGGDAACAAAGSPAPPGPVPPQGDGAGGGGDGSWLLLVVLWLPVRRARTCWIRLRGAARRLRRRSVHRRRRTRRRNRAGRLRRRGHPRLLRQPAACFSRWTTRGHARAAGAAFASPGSSRTFGRRASPQHESTG